MNKQVIYVFVISCALCRKRVPGRIFRKKTSWFSFVHPVGSVNRKERRTEQNKKSEHKISETVFDTKQ